MTSIRCAPKALLQGAAEAQRAPGGIGEGLRQLDVQIDAPPRALSSTRKPNTQTWAFDPKHSGPSEILRLKRKGETSFKPHRYIDPHQEIGSLVRQTKAYKGLHIHSLRQLHGGRKLQAIDV